MVKSASQRIQKTVQKTQPVVVVMRLKALLRAHLLNPSKANTVNALKDLAAKAIIDTYDLDLREKLNAWECWRELYYSYYNKLQSVVQILNRTIQLENEIGIGTATIQALDATTNTPITKIDDLTPFKLRITAISVTVNARLQGITDETDITNIDINLAAITEGSHLDITVFQYGLTTFYLNALEE